MDGPVQSRTDDAPPPPHEPSRATNLRNLLAVAAALRRLAPEARPREAALYLAAAATLEQQAAHLAGLLPWNEDDTPRQATPYKPVDFRI
jgi:hypothetical protein